MVATRHGQMPGGFHHASRRPSYDASDARILVYGLFFKSDAGLKHSSPQRFRVKGRPSARREPSQISKNRASSISPRTTLSRTCAARLALSAAEPARSSAGQEFRHCGCEFVPRAEAAAPPPTVCWRRAVRGASRGTSSATPAQASRRDRAAELPRRREPRTGDSSQPSRPLLRSRRSPTPRARRARHHSSLRRGPRSRRPLRLHRHLGPIP